ncbi:sphingomyelin phosphodiesterase 5-like isoform X2 [Pantherophis guttatus]|uniref:sphingomyelin phosphodiesterase n=1 Tax=Pantherophis guttatus TaxID=94885 RepID=A0A6P9C7R5_PANGU|nr:sphingomyelin phosphodiesterase 5-like isoform X2 [Pantherophis guttatus]
MLRPGTGRVVGEAGKPHLKGRPREAEATAAAATQQGICRASFISLHNIPEAHRRRPRQHLQALRESPRRPPTMGLRESPYSSRVLGGLDTTARALMFPGYWLASEVLALQRTTGEKPGCAPHGLEVAVRGPLLLLLLLLYSPVSLLALLLWLPLQGSRRPFAYQHTPGRAPPEAWALPGPARTLGLLSGNVCLLPEGLAKFSNLWRTQWRARHIGQTLVQAARCSMPHAPSGAPNGLAIPHGLLGPPAGVLSHPRGDAVVTMELPIVEEVGAVAGESKGPCEISVCFPPNLDILCLQEVFDPRAAAHLCRFLGPQFEHIIYDVGTYGLQASSALKLLNSGLFLASRYPLLAVEFHCYPNAAGEDALSAKGLLCTQVQLGACQGRRVIGYLNCTHLQAPEADGPIRHEQLSLSLLWMQLFQDTHAQPGDVVAFDIFCGDLNFDTCSLGDEMEQSHEIFSRYTDPCRIGPRQDEPWAIGTLMNLLHIYDEAVATPENLKRTLENSEERRKYLAGPLQADGSASLSATWHEGRRIDYILYRQHSGPGHLKTTVEKVFFFTQLATCSDHLPIGLQLLVSSEVEPEE